VRIAPHPSAPIGTGLRPDFLPSRLREKIVESEPTKGSGALPWLVAAVVIAVVAVSVLLVVRFDVHLPWTATPATNVAATPSPAPKAAEPSPQPAATQPAPVESTTARATASPKPEPFAETTTPATKKPAAAKPAHKSAPAGGAAAGVAASPKPTASTASKRYGVVVGTYLDQERATSEAARIGAAAKLPFRTMTVQEDGAAVYRVVLGRFDTNTAAEHAATDLIVKGLSNEARVVSFNASSK
jgi:cytoskeletal protein RodZ